MYIIPILVGPLSYTCIYHLPYHKSLWVRQEGRWLMSVMAVMNVAEVTLLLLSFSFYQNFLTKGDQPKEIHPFPCPDMKIIEGHHKSQHNREVILNQIIMAPIPTSLPYQPLHVLSIFSSKCPHVLFCILLASTRIPKFSTNKKDAQISHCQITRSK